MESFQEGSPESDAEISMAKVMRDIYGSCDVDNTNRVAVSDLISVIRPYLENNLSELQSLQNVLDQGNTNPFITSEKFYEAMNVWTAQIKENPNNASDNNNSFNEMNPVDLDNICDKDLPMQCSTPRPSLGTHFLKEYEKGLNLSNVSAYSITDANIPATDTSFLEEKLKELEHQMYRANNEIELLKQQLVATEEQNELLQADLNGTKKRLVAEQQTVSKLQKEKKDWEDLKEELATTKKQNEYIKNNCQDTDRKVHHLNNWIKQLEEEKLNLEKNYDRLKENSQCFQKEVLTLQSELSTKCKEISQLENQNSKLKAELADRMEVIDHLKKTNELLKHENLSFKKTLKAHFSSNGDTIFDQIKSCSPNCRKDVGFRKSIDISDLLVNKSNVLSPLLESSLNLSDNAYNSPKLLNQIAHPVSPTIESPVLSSSSIAKDVGMSRDDSPDFPNKMNLLKKVLLKNTSTPQQGVTTILDSSLPSNSKVLPVMQFTQSSSETNTVNGSSPDSNKECSSEMLSKDSPPVMYVVNRTPAIDEVTASVDIAAENNSSEILKKSLNSSSDEDIYWKFVTADPHNFEKQGDSLKDELENAKETSNEKDNEIHDLLNRLKKHEDCDYVISSYKNENNQLKKELNEYENKCSELQTKITKLKIQLDEEKTLKNNLYMKLDIEMDNEKKLNEVMALNSTLENVLSKERLLVDEYKSALGDRISEIAELQLSHNEENSKKLLEIENLNIKINDLNEQLALLRCELQHKNNDILSLGEKFDESRRERSSLMKELDKQVSNQNDLIKYYQEEIAEREKQIRRLIIEDSEELECREALWQDLKQLSTHVPVTDLEDSKCSLLENIKSELLKENKHLAKKCLDIEELNKELLVTNEELQISKKDKEDNIDKLQNEIIQLKDKFCKCQKNRSYLRKLLTKAEETTEMANKENSELKTKMSDLMNKHELLEAQLEECKNSLNQEQERHDELKKHHSSLECQFKKLESELKEKQRKETVSEGKVNFFKSVLRDAMLYIPNDIFSNENFDSLLSCVKNCNLESIIDTTSKLISTFNLESKQLQKSIKNIVDENNTIKENMQRILGDSNEKAVLLQNELVKEKSNNTDLIHKYDQLNEKFRRYKIKVENMKMTNTSLSQKQQNLSKEKQDLLTENKELSGKVETLDCELYKLKEEFKDKEESLETSVGSISSELWTSLQEVEELKLELNNSKLMLVKLQHYLESETKKLLDEKAQAVYSAEQLITKLKQENAAFLEQQKKLYIEKIELEELLEKNKSEIAAMKSTNWNLSATNEELKGNIEEQNKTIIKFKQENENVELEVLNLKGILFNAIKIIVKVGWALHSSTHLFFPKLKHVLESFEYLLSINCPVPGEMDYDMAAGSAHIAMLIDEEIIRLNHHIDLTTKLLEYLALNTKSFKDVEVQTELGESYLPAVINLSKPIKKFTLRPSKLITSCPASPDSPSFNDVARFAPIDLEINKNKIPDSSQENSKKNYEYDENKLQQVFPSQPDTFLDKLGLLEESPRRVLSRGELEEKFTTLVLTWTIDKQNMIERYRDQHRLYSVYRNDVYDQLSQVISLLGKHLCSDLMETVIPAIDQLEMVKESLGEMFVAAEQYGTMCYEVQNMKCWNLAVNYVAVLRREMDNKICRSPSIKEITPKKSQDDFQCQIGGLRKRKITSTKLLQITLHNENFTCPSEDRLSSKSFWYLTATFITIMTVVTYGFISAIC